MLPAALLLSFGLEFSPASEAPPPSPRHTLSTFSASTIPNALWSQWVWPLFVEVNDDVFGGAVKRGLPAEGEFPKKIGGAWALQALDQGDFAGFQSAPILHVGPAAWTVDDHNAPCVVPDLREGAASALTYFQADHNGRVLRRMSSPALDVSRLSTAEALDLPEGGKCYAMAARNPSAPDTIWLWHRRGASNSGTWRLARSEDNGATWSSHQVFGVPSRSTYFLAKETAAGDGWHLVFHEHPISGKDQRLACLRMGWDGAVSAPGLGTVLAQALEGDAAYDPFNGGASLILRTPGEGRATRLFDFLETEPGFLEVVWAEFTHTRGEGFTGTSREYRHARIDLATGAVVSDTSLGEAGWPQEVPAGGNDYFCGVTVAGPYDIVKAVWSPDDDSHANHLAHRGSGQLVRMTSSDAGASWTSTVLATAPGQKFMRPTVAARYRQDQHGRQRLTAGRRLFVSLGTYRDFNTWEADLKCYPLR